MLRRGPFKDLAELVINPTISQDGSFGRAAAEDTNLASLGTKLRSSRLVRTPSPSRPPPKKPAPGPPPSQRRSGARPIPPSQIANSRRRGPVQPVRRGPRPGPPPSAYRQGKAVRPPPPPPSPLTMNSHYEEEFMEVPPQGPILHAPGTLTATVPTVNTVKEEVLADEGEDEDDDVTADDQEEEPPSSPPPKKVKKRNGRAQKRRKISTESSSEDSSTQHIPRKVLTDVGQTRPNAKKDPKKKKKKKKGKQLNQIIRPGIDVRYRALPPRDIYGSGYSSRPQVLPEDLGQQFEGEVHCAIYRVFCNDRSPNTTTMMYLDVPERTYESFHYHLRGAVEVQDLATFISSAGSLAYIIFRDVKCGDYMRWDMAQLSSSSSGSKLFWKESIAIIDNDLRSCIDSIAQCAPNGRLYDYGSSDGPDYYSREENDRDLYELRFFFHHREVLTAGLPTFPRPLKDHVEDLMEFLQDTHGTLYAETDDLLSQGLVHRDHLEMLFSPNAVVVSRQNGSLSAFVLRSWPIGNSSLTLDCWYWGFDGEWFHRKSITRYVQRPLKNVVRVRDLEVFPLRFATEQEKSTLELRGQKFWSLRYQHLASYEGWDFKAEQHYSNEARCMIDYKTYRRFHPRAEMFRFSDESLAPFDRWPEHIPHNATLDNDLMILLPPFIHGFFLKDKKWVTLSVDKVGSVTWNKDAFERLVLSKKTKDLVKGLVMVRTSNLGEKQGMSLAGKGKRDDLIAGKGNGLIMLLHGSPGTGKTLTAESVAEMAEMPLYNVTCGDIGTSADEVEKYLQTVLVLGKAWNCVLLLDEADVFLEERSLSDLERNSLVSVFLRTLEYYDGILILTSNRVGTFDEAFKSRIQVALHYPNLDRIARKKIWKNFLDMMEVDEENVNLDELANHIQELADQDMNGREIRNALTTARQLALFQKETLGWEHVEQAITTSRDFKKYLGAVHKHTDDQYARDQEMR